MARNYINDGAFINFTAAADIASGQGVVVGSVLGVALESVKTGAVGGAAIFGAFELPKLAGADIAQGDPLIWDVDAGEFIVASPDAGDLLNCAIAIDAAGTGTTTVRARLSPGSAPFDINIAVVPSVITPGASPYTYANASGFDADVLVAGGTVSAIAFSRDGATFYPVGITAGSVHLSPGDKVKVTYSVVPTMTLVPR